MSVDLVHRQTFSQKGNWNSMNLFQLNECIFIPTKYLCIHLVHCQNYFPMYIYLFRIGWMYRILINWYPC
jgi:hypothetical protein